MVRLIHRLLAFTAVVPLSIGGIAAASASSSSADGVAWTEAAAQDTLEAYAAFAMDYPDSGFAAEARARLIAAAVSGVATGQGPSDISEGQASFPDFVPDSLMVV